MTYNASVSKLRILIAQNRMTQLEIATGIGVSERSLRRYLQGKKEPPLWVVLSIERLLCKNGCCNKY